MNNQRSGMLMPAVVGGVAAGVLSAVPFLGCLCCLWIIGGAMLAAYLLARNSPASLSAGDGAIVGIFTGIVAAVVDSVVSIPFEAANREIFSKFMEQISHFTEEMPSGWETWFEKTAEGVSPGLFMLGLVIAAVVFSVFGALGGVIGVSLFGRKKIPPAQGASHEIPQDTGDR
ncbi:MAG: hypothetical protein QHH14_01900 [Clostridiales bacterium]|nr:hypothetical protein [Clostridiales bacterium]